MEARASMVWYEPIRAIASIIEKVKRKITGNNGISKREK
jgi:hypothetical protein